jgi:hypothetical protein
MTVERSHLNRITCINKISEVNALYNSTVGDIEAGNDAD